MKPIIAIVLLLALSQVARGQDRLYVKSWEKDEYRGITRWAYGHLDTAVVSVFLGWWDKWVDSCKRDTIHAVPLEGEYIVDYGSYREMVSERQLEDRGYRFKYRWITNTTQPFEWDYVFLREPTLSGFMEFIRRTK